MNTKSNIMIKILIMSLFCQKPDDDIHLGPATKFWCPATPSVDPGSPTQHGNLS